MKEQFWADVNKAMKGSDGHCCTRDALILAGDFNGELPSYHDVNNELDLPRTVARWGMGSANSNGLRLYEEATASKLCAVGSPFRKPFNKKWTFFGAFDVSQPQVRNRREYDHIFIPFRLRATATSLRVIRYALHDSDHCPVLLTIAPRLPNPSKTRSSFVLTKHPRDPAVAKKVDLALSNRFQTLFEEHVDDSNITQVWSSVNQVILDTAYETNERPLPRKPWISNATMNLICLRSEVRSALLHSNCLTESSRLQKSLSQLRKEVCKSSRQDYKNWVRETIENVEHANRVGDSRRLCANFIGRNGSTHLGCSFSKVTW